MSTCSFFPSFTCRLRKAFLLISPSCCVPYPVSFDLRVLLITDISQLFVYSFFVCLSPLDVISMRTGTLWCSLLHLQCTWHSINISQINEWVNVLCFLVNQDFFKRGVWNRSWNQFNGSRPTFWQMKDWNNAYQNALHIEKASFILSNLSQYIFHTWESAGKTQSSTYCGLLYRFLEKLYTRPGIGKHFLQRVQWQIF